MWGLHPESLLRYQTVPRFVDLLARDTGLSLSVDRKPRFRNSFARV